MYVSKNSLKMQSRSGIAMDLASPCVSLKAAKPYSSKERCYELQCRRLAVDQRKRLLFPIPLYSIFGTTNTGQIIMHICTNEMHTNKYTLKSTPLTCNSQ